MTPDEKVKPMSDEEFRRRIKELQAESDALKLEWFRRMEVAEELANEMPINASEADE